MDLNARVDVHVVCGRKDVRTDYERTDRRTDERKTGRLYRTLLKRMRRKSNPTSCLSNQKNGKNSYDTAPDTWILSIIVLREKKKKRKNMHMVLRSSQNPGPKIIKNCAELNRA